MTSGSENDPRNIEIDPLTILSDEINSTDSGQTDEAAVDASRPHTPEVIKRRFVLYRVGEHVGSVILREI